jgi:LacI family transcriptional regulator
LANSKRVDSLIIINPRRGDRALEIVLKTKFPVLVAGTSEGSGKNTIATQEGLASRRATDHLISLGHRRIAHISHASLDYVSALRRLQGYRAALKAAGLRYEHSFVRQADFSLASGYHAMKEMLNEHTRPTALFAGNDTVAIGAMLAVRESGLSIPHDMAIVGYDDVPGAAFACPPLTTIRTHAYEHGKLFAEAAIRLMKQEKIDSRQDALPLELVIRDSCGAKHHRSRSKHLTTTPQDPPTLADTSTENFLKSFDTELARVILWLNSTCHHAPTRTSLCRHPPRFLPARRPPPGRAGRDVVVPGCSEPGFCGWSSLLRR